MENPYWLSLIDPQPAYWAKIGAWSAAYGLLFVAVDRLVSRGAGDAKKAPALEVLSSPRPGTGKGGKGQEGADRSGLSAATTVCSMVHAIGTTYAAARTCWLLVNGDPEGLAAPLWQAALAFSQGYFVADGLLYGTRRETWVIIHHTWMLLAHHPIGEPLKGCMLMGCGDCNRAIWLSATGYAAELSTVFLNIRLLQLKLMRKHSIWYTINSALLLVTYPITRVGGAAAIILGSLLPHWDEYKRNGVSNLIVFTGVTYGALALMSLYYTYTLFNKGLARALFFKPADEKDKEK